MYFGVKVWHWLSNLKGKFKVEVWSWYLKLKKNKMNIGYKIWSWKNALNIKNISSLYIESHAVTHAATRLLGDLRVNTIIDNRLDRESDYVRKQSVTVRSEAEFQKAFSYNCVQREIPAISSETLAPLKSLLMKLRKMLKLQLLLKKIEQSSVM